MDYSSCIPAGCLDVKEGIKVLELGSAPGNKACTLQIIQNRSI
jgi:16S rRNA C967 or C1407 C5-methylase (RsmB/RsmF family)